MTREEAAMLYSLMEKFIETVEDEINELGSSGDDDRAMQRQGDLDTLRGSLEVMAEDFSDRFPADTVAP